MSDDTATVYNRPSPILGISTAVNRDTPLSRIADMTINLKYVDMMEYARGLYELVETGKVESPEQLAASLHTWASKNAGPTK